MASGYPYRLVTSLKYWLLASGALLAGIGLLYVSGLKWFAKHESFGTLANQLGGLLIASVALATLWDLVGKRSFMDEVVEVVQLKHEVLVAGLEGITTDYNKSLDWDSCLASAHKLDIFAAWATTWRNTYQTRLTELAGRSDAKIRICLPDPTDNACLRHLANRFNMASAQEVRTKLNEAIEGYKKLDGTRGTGRVEIYTSPVFRAFTAYRIDDQFVVTLYHHKESRSGSVPALTCRRGGSLFTFFLDDLEGVLNASTTRKVYP